MTNQSGVSLIEILISLLILSLALLGLDAMQLTALREAKTAYYYSVATQQLNVAIARAELQTTADWNKQNASVLPHGSGVITNDTISIFWGNNQKEPCQNNQIGNAGCLSIKI